MNRLLLARTPEQEPPEAGISIDVAVILGIVRRQWKAGLVTLAAVCLLAIAYLLTAMPLYTASVGVLIDRSTSDMTQRLSTLGGAVDDEASVLSQIELIRSETIGLAAVDRLQLERDADFMAPVRSVGALPRRLLGALRGMFSAARETSSNVRDRRQALAIVQEGLDVERVGRSYVLTISFESPSPEHARAVATAVAEAYLADKLEARYAAARRAGDWLAERIEDLRRQSVASDLAVQRFKAENGLLPANNRSMPDQQVADLNTALIVARADTAKAKARLDRIEAILASGSGEAIVADALDNAVITAFRARYLEASKREADIRARFGADHAQAVRLRRDMQEFSRLMGEELGRIAEGYRSDLDVARSREVNLTENLARATRDSALAGEKQAELRALERSAENDRLLHESFLRRYQDAVQGQDFPLTDARIITEARLPEGPSSPRKGLVMALAVLFGAAAACGMALLREYRERFFRNGGQIRSLLGLEYLGAIPLTETGNDLARHALDFPLSGFTETLRNCRLAIDIRLRKQAKVIGVVSTLPGEGKTTLAVNLAQVLAAGRRTLLIDADLRNPGASRMLGLSTRPGLVEALTEGLPLSQARAEQGALHILPAAAHRPISHSAELLTSAAMARLLQEAGRDYDYILLDLPPLAPVIDSRAMAGVIDGFILAIEWGGPSRVLVRDTLVGAGIIEDRCLGAVLTKVDRQQMPAYAAADSSEAYGDRYGAYLSDRPA